MAPADTSLAKIVEQILASHQDLRDQPQLLARLVGADHRDPGVPLLDHLQRLGLLSSGALGTLDMVSKGYLASVHPSSIVNGPALTAWIARQVPAQPIDAPLVRVSAPDPTPPRPELGRDAGSPPPARRRTTTRRLLTPGAPASPLIQPAPPSRDTAPASIKGRSESGRLRSVTTSSLVGDLDTTGVLDLIQFIAPSYHHADVAFQLPQGEAWLTIRGGHPCEASYRGLDGFMAFLCLAQCRIGQFWVTRVSPQDAGEPENQFDMDLNGVLMRVAMVLDELQLVAEINANGGEASVSDDEASS